MKKAIPFVFIGGVIVIAILIVLYAYLRQPEAPPEKQEPVSLQTIPETQTAPPEQPAPPASQSPPSEPQEEPPTPQQPSPQPPSYGIEVEPVKDFPEIPSIEEVEKKRQTDLNYVFIDPRHGERPTGWLHLKDKILVLEAEIASPDMPIEFLLSAEGGKEYESIIKIYQEPADIHLALGVIAGKEGPPPDKDKLGKIDDRQGKRLVVFVQFETPDKKILTYRIEDLIYNVTTKTTLKKVGWVYIGTGYTKKLDPGSEPKDIPIVDILRFIGSVDLPEKNALLYYPLLFRGNTQAYRPNFRVIPPPEYPCKVIIRLATEDEIKEIEEIERKYKSE